jgi:hypothetical protein
MSVIQQIGQQIVQKLVDVKLDEVKGEIPKKFIIITDVELQVEEYKTLEIHGGYSQYVERYASLSIKDLFIQAKKVFIVLNFNSHDGKAYVQSHWSELEKQDGFKLVVRKSTFEDYDEEHLLQFSKIGATILKNLANEVVKDDDYYTFLINFKRIAPSPNCLKLVWRTISSFLG